MYLSLILYDCFLLWVTVLTYGSACVLAAASWPLFTLLPWPWRGFALPLLALLAVLALILATALLRQLLPRLREGHFAAPLSPEFYVWTAHLALNRMIFLLPVKNIVLYSALLRWLAFRALGARLAYGTSISANVELTDLPLIEIGPGCVIGARSLLSGHYLNKGNLYLGRIRIGARVNIGGYTRIGPGVEIGDDSWIGADCQIAPMVRIGAGCTVEPMSVLPPGTHLEAGQVWPPPEQPVWV
jgi:hypothetical protein